MLTVALRQENTNTYNVRVYFHVIRRTDETGGQSVQRVQGAYDILNEDFNPHDIFFHWDGEIDYIDDDSHFLNPDDEIFSINKHSDGVDIYLYDDRSQDLAMIDGITGMGPNAALLISGEQGWVDPNLPLVTTSSVSHEMGHVFNLWHTHNGTSGEISGDEGETGQGKCAELADGSNGEDCGDYVADTPADPGLEFDVDVSTCEWNGSGGDHTGSYNPDTNLIMAYANAVCMEYFSPGQGTRMRNALETKPHLTSTLIQESQIDQCQDILVSGPGTLCPNDNVYILDNAPDGFEIVWIPFNATNWPVRGPIRS